MRVDAAEPPPLQHSDSNERRARLADPTNPWSGTDASLAATIAAHILGVPPLPGGAAPEDVEEAYAAVYTSAKEPVLVQAVRFNRTPPTVPLRGGATQRSVRIERDRTVVVVSGGDEDPASTRWPLSPRKLAPSTAQPAK
jgi:hypothetical protein